MSVADSYGLPLCFKDPPLRVGWRNCQTWQECHEYFSMEAPYEEAIAEAEAIIRANRKKYTLKRTP